MSTKQPALVASTYAELRAMGIDTTGFPADCAKLTLLGVVPLDGERYVVWVDRLIDPQQLAHVRVGPDGRVNWISHPLLKPYNTRDWAPWFQSAFTHLHEQQVGGRMGERMALLTEWDLLGKVIAAGSPRVLVYGPPGLGKSYTPAKIARDLKWEFLSITLTDQTPMTELRGHFVLKGNEFVWHDGIIARAWRMTQAGKGVILELNEIIEAGSDVEVFLHNALDDPEFARLDLPTGETLRPVAGKIVVVATMNAEPMQLRDALRDRFPVVIPITSVHPDAITSLPSDLRALALKMCDPKKSDRMSVRPFVAFAHLRTVMPVAQAAQAVFGAAAHDVVAALALAKVAPEGAK